MCAAALALLLLFAAECEVAAAAAAPYVWPMDIPKIVTSSFGEYRGGRYHKGIDLRTGGIDRQVRAPAAGAVSRVRCSPWGYGKAVYILLDDGNTAVFAHLSDFAPALRDYVQKAQHESQNYTVDLHPPAGMFRFEAGEVVAMSGSTGVGPPHLHYELRDRNGRPFNPRLAGVTWPDSTRPTLRKIAVVPHGPCSRVNGDVKPVVLDCLPDGAGRYRAGAVRASGRIGVGIDVIDPANNGANRLGIHTLRTLAGDGEIFSIRKDVISYEESRHEAVAYHPFLSDIGRFLLQWRWPGNECNVFHGDRDGWIEVRDEPTEVTLEASDFFGNRAAVTFTVVPEDEPSAPAAPDVADPGHTGEFEVDCAGTWLTVTARFPGPEPVAPRLVVEGASETGAFLRVGQRTFRAAFTPDKAASSLIVGVEHPRLDRGFREIWVFHAGAPRRTAVATSGDARHRAEITVHPGSPYGVLFLQAETFEPAGAPPAPRRGPAWRLWPAQTPVNAPVELALPIPADAENPAKLAIYRRTSRGWSMLRTRNESGRLVASLTRFGEFAVLEDTAPPRIWDIVVRDGEVSARVADAASGIARADITCNGKWLLAAYDPFDDRIDWERDHELPPPPWEFVFTATDNAGNTAKAVKKVERLPAS